jgi:hypothetical protein
MSVDRNARWLYGQIKRVHVNRVVGCNCHYCTINGDTNAGIKPGKETGKVSRVSDEPAPMEFDLGNVLPG